MVGRRGVRGLVGAGARFTRRLLPSAVGEASVEHATDDVSERSLSSYLVIQKGTMPARIRSEASGASARFACRAIDMPRS